MLAHHRKQRARLKRQLAAASTAAKGKSGSIQTTKILEKRRRTLRRQLQSAHQYEGQGGISASYATQMCTCDDENTTMVDYAFGLDVRPIKRTITGGRLCQNQPTEMLAALEIFPLQALFKRQGAGGGTSRPWFGPQLSWLLQDRLASEKCTVDPPGLVGYIDLPMDGLDLPYQMWVFADGDKPYTSVLKVVPSNMQWVEHFRAWNARMGLSRDLQWNTEFAIWGVRPFHCSWPDDKNGCEQAALPRGFFTVTIDELVFGNLARALLPSTPGENLDFFDFDLLNTRLTVARSPSGYREMSLLRTRGAASATDGSTDGVSESLSLTWTEGDDKQWDQFALLMVQDSWEHFTEFCDDLECDDTETEVEDQRMVPEEVQYARADGVYFTTRFGHLPLPSSPSVSSYLSAAHHPTRACVRVFCTKSRPPQLHVLPGDTSVYHMHAATDDEPRVSHRPNGDLPVHCPGRG